MFCCQHSKICVLGELLINLVLNVTQSEQHYVSTDVRFNLMTRDIWLIVFLRVAICKSLMQDYYVCHSINHAYASELPFCVTHILGRKTQGEQ